MPFEGIMVYFGVSWCPLVIVIAIMTSCLSILNLVAMSISSYLVSTPWETRLLEAAHHRLQSCRRKSNGSVIAHWMLEKARATTGART